MSATTRDSRPSLVGSTNEVSMRSLQKAFIGAAVVLIPTGVIGATRVLAFLQAVRRPAPILSAAPTTLPSPAIDASRKTVAILLGDVSEVTDVLGPYEMFARAGEFNVLTVAVDRRPVRLTSGLAVMPHMTLAELEESLGVTAPDVVVVPHIPNIDRAVNRPLLDVMRRWSAESSLMLSWCTGAGALAESGVLDGRRATAHWGDIDRLQRKYPNVKWQRGVRWVDEESVVASAGLTSGIDATLRVIRRLAGEESALRVARELHYPNYHYSLEPAAPQYTARL